jgi:hypothetical protein
VVLVVVVTVLAVAVVDLVVVGIVADVVVVVVVVVLVVVVVVGVVPQDANTRVATMRQLSSIQIAPFFNLHSFIYYLILEDSLKIYLNCINHVRMLGDNIYFSYPITAGGITLYQIC